MAFDSLEMDRQLTAANSKLGVVFYNSEDAWADEIGSGGDLDVSASTTAASKWFVANMKNGGLVIHGQRTSAGVVATTIATVSFTAAGAVTLAKQA